MLTKSFETENVRSRVIKQTLAYASLHTGQLIGISVFVVVVLLRSFSVVDSVLAANVLQNLVRKQ